MSDAFQCSWSLVKFDEQRSQMGRQIEADMPVEDEKVDLNFKMGGNQGDCCEKLKRGFVDLMSDYLRPESIKSFIATDCEDMIESYYNHLKPDFEIGSGNKHIQILLEDMEELIEEYNSCLRGNFDNVEFNDNFLASRDVFEDSWKVVKMAKKMSFEEFSEYLDKYHMLGLTDHEKEKYYEMYILGMRWARA